MVVKQELVKAIGRRRMVRSVLLASSMLTAATVAAAQDDPPPLRRGVDIITVTAQKKSESVQDVPISIIALGTEKLDELQVSQFSDYAKFIPSLTYQSTGPNYTTVYFRGVASGGDGNHSASLPSVGVYLDEQPVTTILGLLPIHVYDVERVEGIAGPQGTLYGASAQSGVVKIVTNKPDLPLLRSHHSGRAGRTLHEAARPRGKGREGRTRRRQRRRGRARGDGPLRDDRGRPA